MTKTRRAWIASITLLLLTGCAGASAPTPTVTATPTPEAGPTEVPPEPADHALGEVIEHSGGWKVTLHQVVLDSALDGPQPEAPGDKWASIDIESCNGTTPDAYITTSPWRLVANDNRQFQSSSIGYNSFPNPDYAAGDTPIAANECIRGWITFVVARDAAITTVKYSPSLGDPIAWTVG
jgi:hypothetical protein